MTKKYDGMTDVERYQAMTDEERYAEAIRVCPHPQDIRVTIRKVGESLSRIPPGTSFEESMALVKTLPKPEYHQVPEEFRGSYKGLQDYVRSLGGDPENFWHCVVPMESDA